METCSFSLPTPPGHGALQLVDDPRLVQHQLHAVVLRHLRRTQQAMEQTSEQRNDYCTAQCKCGAAEQQQPPGCGAPSPAATGQAGMLVSPWQTQLRSQPPPWQPTTQPARASCAQVAFDPGHRGGSNDPQPPNWFAHLFQRVDDDAQQQVDNHSALGHSRKRSGRGRREHGQPCGS